MNKKHIFSFVIIFIIFSMCVRVYATITYNNAVDSMNKKDYEKAIEYFQEVGDYKDSLELLENVRLEQKYNEALILFKNEKYQEAKILFDELMDFKEGKNYSRESYYRYAIQLYDCERYEEAAQIFMELKENNYKDSKIYAAKALLPEVDRMKELLYVEACTKYESKDYKEALDVFEKLEDYKESQKYIEECQEQISRRELAETLSAGTLYTLGIKNDGTVISTGYNKDGQSNVTEWEDIVSIAGKGIMSIGLQEDGIVVTTGGIAVDTSNWDEIIDIAAGDRYILGLKADGKVVGQGHDLGDGQLDVTEWKNIVDIEAGWRHTIGLDTKGNIFITGFGSNKLIKQYNANREKWTNIVDISTGGGVETYGHILGLREDGTVVAIGNNTFGQCNVEEWTDIIAVAAGDWHSVGLKKDGSVVAVGTDGKANFYSYENACSVEEWTDIVAISAGSGYTVGLKKDGSVVAVGYNDENKMKAVNAWKDIRVYEEYIK